MGRSKEPNCRLFFLASSAILLVLSAAAHAQQPTLLQTVVVEGEGEAQSGEFDGYAAKTESSATKGDVPLSKVPQAVSSVSAQQIKDQNARTVMEATRYSPGIRSDTFGNDVRNDWFLIRGFTSQISSYFLDGLQLQSSDSYATWKMNPYLLERIDILRGPSGALYGASNPGGLINMVSKRPEFRNGGEASIGVNEHGNVWSGIDAQGVNADGTLAYRFVATGNIGDTEVDYIDDDQLAIMPVITWHPSEDTKLTVYGHYSKTKSNNQNFLPYEGTVVAAPFGHIRRDLFTGEPANDKYDREQAMFGYEFEHSFNDRVTVRQNLRYAHLSTDIYGSYGLNWVAPPTSTSAEMARGSYASNPELGLFTVDNQLEVKSDTGPLAHTLLFGIDYKHFDLDDSQAFGTATPFDVLDPTYGGTFTLPPPTLSHTVQQQLGFYAQDRIEYDRLNLVFSGRYDYVSTDTDVTGTPTKFTDDAFSGRAGIIYNFDNGLSPYASVSRSFLPLAGKDDVTGDAFTPETATQYEAGLRYQPDFLNGGYIGAAVFDLRRENFVTSDGVNFSRQIGKINSRGFELEAAGYITPDLKLTAAYTWYDLKVKEGNPAEIGHTPAGVPEQFGSLWLDYAVPYTPLEGLSVGAGVRYVGSSYVNSTNTLEVPDSVVFDAAIRYEKENFAAAFNVANLFDKHYVATCNYEGGCYYGQGREASLTLTYKW
ncbi:TonB-dependent siderophore receptor [Mesorhizobium sp. ZC-5]|uniref:TonB-dependent siderophore receptor n=1 Tax=Mesorhizobium sp. ZC-5 TaxID=2986066 RepID=UPI0021E70AA0|nr:TonB-dependent siderophore receptor [Mesorhizobium sp. ZC-5]MCV3241759.1 TonB-dependent siderophore receptor [Mesorhizobium sp. ZC-5]